MSLARLLSLGAVVIPTIRTLSLLAKFTSFPTNHFPDATLFTLTPPVAQRQKSDKRFHKKFHGALWWPFHPSIQWPKR
jgi:hypothetical protein